MALSEICCEYHDKIVLDVEEIECGHAGMGAPTVCCRNCPDNVYPSGMAWIYKDEQDDNGNMWVAM
jgi:hypothetical protein